MLLPRLLCALFAVLLHACRVSALPRHPWRQAARAARVARTTDDGGALFFDQRLDHFAPGVSVTWRQRYFLNDSAWQAGGRRGPVFVCVGGEGPPLQPSVVVTGDAHCADAVGLAERVGALVVALEHRFYGESTPTRDLTTASLRLLSAHQALADLSHFHRRVRARRLHGTWRGVWRGVTSHALR